MSEIVTRLALSDHPRAYRCTPAEHAACIVSLAEWLDLRDVVIVGYDWGGPIGLAVALEEHAHLRGRCPNGYATCTALYCRGHARVTWSSQARSKSCSRAKSVAAARVETPTFV
jgi:pimeloyl-ACP methyl ester carboxylesterase